ncbi:MAG: hypothetical protein HFI77_15195 [Lachnospiraceae bacterium]|nr:hypothetical protein [Lachnospiraceae bacterium]
MKSRSLYQKWQFHIQKCIGENARVVQNQGEYAKRYDALVGRFEMSKARLEEVQAAITEKQVQRKMMEVPAKTE